MAETSGTGISVIEAAMHSAPGPPPDQLGQDELVQQQVTDVGVTAASCDSPYVASGRREKHGSGRPSAARRA